MRQLYEGRIPLWTNRVGCGFPFLANPQTQSLYPPTLLGEWLLEVGRKFGIGRDQPLPLRSARLMAWLVFLHTLLALAGAYLLIRSFGISRWASLVGSAAYGLGSFQTAWALLPTLPATAAWLPLTLWLVRQIFASAQAKQNGIAKLVNYAFALSLSLAMLCSLGTGKSPFTLCLRFCFSLSLKPFSPADKSAGLRCSPLSLRLSFLSPSQRRNCCRRWS